MFHATSEKRLPKILQKGLSPSIPQSREWIAEDWGESIEEIEDCSSQAEYELNEIINRGDSVYFWNNKGDAIRAANSLDLPYKQFILEIDPNKIEIDRCYTNNSSITDEIYDEFYYSCMQEIPVNIDKVEKLAEEWEKTIEQYNPNNKYPDHYETWCHTSIPPRAIKNVYDNRGRVCKIEKNKVVCPDKVVKCRHKS